MLVKPSLFITMYQLGWKQLIPFVIIVLGVIFTNILIVIGLGLMVGIVVILIKNFRNSHFLHIEDKIDGKTELK